MTAHDTANHCYLLQALDFSYETCSLLGRKRESDDSSVVGGGGKGGIIKVPLVGGCLAIHVSDQQRKARIWKGAEGPMKTGGEAQGEDQTNTDTA